MSDPSAVGPAEEPPKAPPFLTPSPPVIAKPPPAMSAPTHAGATMPASAFVGVSPAAGQIGAPGTAPHAGFSPSTPYGAAREAAPRAKREPIWASLVALIAAFLASSVAAGLAVVVYVAARDPSVLSGDVGETLQAWIDDHLGDPVLTTALILPAQLAMLATAVIFALPWRENVFKRLGFVRGHATVATIVWAVLGTLGVQFAISCVAELLIDDLSESLRKIWLMFNVPTGAAAVYVGLLMSVLPGICEESLFRGCAQRGLLRRWKPFPVILLTSVAFALAHFDKQHSPGVFPLGVWFGVVAWKTGSIWPSIACHFANNLVAFVVGRAWGDPESGEVGGEVGALYYVVGAAFLVCTAIATVALVRTKVPGPSAPGSMPAP